MAINRRQILGAALATPAVMTAGLTRVAHAEAAQSHAAITHKFTVGDATVTALLDGHVGIGSQVISQFDQATVDAVLKDTLFTFGPQGMQIPVNGYLIERAGKYTLLDAGAAGLFGPTLGNLAASLAATGVTPEQISTILLTHMHIDHTGGLVTAEGQAIFPNAELVVAEAEFAFWYDDAIMSSVPESNRPFFEGARFTTAPYADRLKTFNGEHEVAAGFTSLPLPGHTPGHTGYMLDGGSESLLFWGDVVHLTGLQFALPDWTLVFDTDPALTVETRKKMLDRASADKMLVTGAHIEFPGLGKVIRKGADYGFAAAPWQFSA
ncbi:MAG: MBL fold metallo-hydrolase [Lentilitoribacter sp.]